MRSNLLRATATDAEGTSGATKKPEYTLSVQYESKDGTWKTAPSTREFSAPDETAEISVKVVDEEGKEKTFTRKFKRSVVSTPQEFLAKVQENVYAEMAARNYGYDLFYRNVCKGPITVEVEGPGAVYKKMAEQLIAARIKLGKSAISFEDALARVKRDNED